MSKCISKGARIKVLFYIAFKGQLKNERRVEGGSHQEIHTGDSTVRKVHYRRVMRADRIF